MPSISKRSILRVIAGASLIVAIICIFNPKYEPWIPVVAAIVTFASSFAVSDTPISIPTSEKTKSAREERNRERMLELVKNSWVKGVLEQSLHEEVLIELGLEERKDAVLNRQGMELQRTGKPNRLLPAGTKVMDVFDEVGQTLLILGEPGSGKTTLLLELARDTIDRAEKDPKHRIPVVFNLSSWTDAKQPIADWLVDELKTKYYTPKKIASDWIENDDLLLLLDGVDEVLPERREACARAINNFRHEHGLTPLVVCCRNEEYEALTAHLDLEGAVCLQPLTEKQVDDYLDQMGQELAALRTTLKDDSELCELAQPLMLSIMTLAYRGISVHDLQPLEAVDARRKHLFDNYVERMFKPRTHRTILDVSDDKRPDDERFSKEESIHWLSWLAKRMLQHGQTVFLIEKMQPGWLPTRPQQWIMVVGVAATILLSFALVFVQLVGLFGLLFVLCIGIVIWPLEYRDDIQLVETLHFSWSAMRTSVTAGRRFTLIFAALCAGVVGWLVGGLVFGLSGGLSVGLVGWLPSGLVKGEIVTRTFPNEGIRRSARNALLGGLFAGLVGCIVFGLFIEPSFELLSGMVVVLGLFGGLTFGGRACIQHLVLRIMLWRNGSAPLHYARFLDYAAGHTFLRKVGGGYIFVHRLLLEYFASLEPDSQDGGS
jgi:predicted ATPase